VEDLGQSWYDSSIPSFQHGVLESKAAMDVSGRILRIWMPASMPA
jgi:hypothetical protein